MAGYIKKNNEFIPLTGDGYGLPLGTWISYEGTCPDGFIESEQTFNTTTYASLYALLGTNKVPARFDHSKLSDWESVTLSTDSNNPTVMRYDGFISCVQGTPQGYWNAIWINGEEIVAGENGNSAGNDGFVCPVKHNDEVYVISSNMNVNWRGSFYKRHLAIKATPAYVEPDTVSDMVHTMRVQDSYSTEEVNTGKTWIDGKPIYRRVYNISLTFNGDTWKDSGITNTTIDVITYSCCFGYDIAYPNQLTKFGATMVSKNTNNKLMVWLYNRGSVSHILIEYTKTTD